MSLDSLLLTKFEAHRGLRGIPIAINIIPPLEFSIPRL